MPPTVAVASESELIVSGWGTPSPFLCESYERR